MKDKLMVVKDKLNAAKDRAKRFHSKFKAAAIIILVVILVLALFVALTGFLCSQIKVNKLENANEKPVIKEYFVADELKKIGELNAAEYTYTIERSYSDYRTVLKCNVPFTEKSLFMQYSGEVEVGYNVADMKYEKKGDKKIEFRIPEPIVENCISKEVTKHEDGNVFNPINSEDFAMLRDGVLDEGLSKAVEKGIYETAENNLKSMITNHFEEFGYTVEFV